MLAACGPAIPAPVTASPPTQVVSAPTAPAQPTVAGAPTSAPVPTATAAPAAASAVKRGGVIVTADFDDPTTFDPAQITNSTGRRVARALYDPLVELDPANNVIPALAESWENPDPTTWVFHLRKGVKFHDGTDFDASAVKYHFDRHLDPKNKSMRAAELTQVASAEVVDTGTLRLHMKQPYPQLLYVLFDWSGFVVSPAAVEKFGADYGQHPVGTGPFSFVEYANGDHTLLQRNPNYWKPDKPALDGVRFRPIVADATREVELRSGGVHIAHDLPFQDVERVRGMSEVVLSRLLGSRYDYWRWNTTGSPYGSSLQFRQAFNWALDRDAIHAAVFFNTGRIGFNPFHIGTPFYDETYKPFTHDLDKAKALLDQAQVPQPARFTIYTRPDPVAVKIIEVIAANLADVAVTIDVQQEDGAAYQARTDRGDYHLGVYQGFLSWRPDPAQYIRRWFHSSTTLWKEIAKDPEIDRLIEASEVETDLAKRQAIYSQFSVRQNDIASAVFTHHGESFIGLSPKVKGWVHMPDQQPRFQDLWLDT
jgi:peptide/nickel transport system substrate-binding protein